MIQTRARDNSFFGALEMEKKTNHVLLIEDDPDFILLLKERLSASREFSFDVEAIDNLSSGLKRLLKGGIDVILLDLNLRDSQGIGTVRWVCSRTKSIPIVVLTGEYDEHLGEEALKLGAQDYLLKSQIGSQDLSRAIRYAIERKRQEEVLRRAYSEVSQLLALVPSVLIRIDPEDRIIAWNYEAERVLGVPHKKAIDQPLSQSGAEWDYQTLSQGISECREKKIPLRLNDIAFKRSTGEKGILGVTVNPIIDPDTQQIGILIYGADITERRRLEVEFPRR
jgi:PAS domain S-box-containing protein